MKAPRGAMTEQERAKCQRRVGDKDGRGSYYRVDDDGDLSYANDPTHAGFLFTSRPPFSYYFTNYFHALAYSLQLKARLKEQEHGP